MRPRAVLRTLFYAKAKHVDRAWLKFLAGRSNVVVANADEGFRGSLQKLAAALQRGNNVMIFPEGTRSAGRRARALQGELRDPGARAARPRRAGGDRRRAPRAARRPLAAAPAGEGPVTYLEPLRPRADEAVETFNQRVRDAVAAQLALGRGQQPAG